MQDYFQHDAYNGFMAQTVSKLRKMRESAGISQRELARIIGQDSSNVSYWERTGKIPRSEVLIPIAKALGTTVEELLGAPKAKSHASNSGKLSKVFDRVRQLPRRQQDKIIEMAEGFLALHEKSEGNS